MVVPEWPSELRVHDFLSATVLNEFWNKISIKIQVPHSVPCLATLWSAKSSAQEFACGLCLALPVLRVVSFFSLVL